MIYLIYGWTKKGGLFNEGFAALYKRIVAEGFKATDVYHWDDPDRIIKAIHQQPKSEKTVLIGYSLGANCCSWVASAGQPIELIVAYDPTRRSYVNTIKSNVKRTICYYQTWWIDPYGGAKLQGHNVELVHTKVPHAFVPYQKDLNKRTFQALEEVGRG